MRYEFSLFLQETFHHCTTGSLYFCLPDETPELHSAVTDNLHNGRNAICLIIIISYYQNKFEADIFNLIMLHIGDLNANMQVTSFQILYELPFS